MEHTPRRAPDILILEVDESMPLPRPERLTEFEDWGAFDPRARPTEMLHWLIVLADDDTVAVGSLSAHPSYYGPTMGSRAMNIGVSVLESYRGCGIASIAQRLLAEELHSRGVVRVEASTDVRNLAEQRALARAGFRLEGVMRRAQGRRDGVHDLQLWSHVAPD